MRFFYAFIVLFFSTYLTAQTTINYVLNNANIHIQQAPITSGFIPATNYATITKPLLAEAFATNVQAGINSNTIHPGSGNVNDVFFGGDLPSLGTGLGAVSVPVLTKQTFDLSDFPVLLKCNFYNSVNVPLYNESYLQIVPANYQYFGTATTNIPNVAQREGILFGGYPSGIRTFNHLNINQNSSVTNYPGAFANNGSWYTMEVLLDVVNGNLVAQYYKVNNQTVLTNVSFGSISFTNNYRLGFIADDLAEGFEITTNYSPISADFQISNTTICEGNCVNLTDLSNCTNCNSYQWAFTGANQNTSTQQNPSNICFQNAGTYPISLTVSDGTNTATITKNITVLPAPTVDLADEIEVCLGEIAVIDATTTDANIYLWNDGTTNPIIEISSEGQYSVVATNNCGTSIDSVFISFIDCNCYIAIPNAFSPQNSQNTTFYPITEGVCNFTNYRFLIFNRWGNQVFETNDINTQWDGIYKNELQPQDTYTWIIDYELDSGAKKILKGSVLLVR